MSGNILTATIASVGYAIQNNSLKFSDKVNQRSTCSFTLVDAAGTASFSKGQPVVISDSVLGTLFSGFVNKPKANVLYPNASRRWTIDCLDQIWCADKVVSDIVYNNQPASVILCDQLQTILAAEGVTGAYALDYEHYETDWAAGGATLSGVVATANTGDGNVGDGDLELSPAGTLLSYTDTLSAGTLTNVAVVNGALELASTQGLQLLGTAVQGLSANPYIYYQIWAGSVGIATGDTLVYDVWIASSSPAQEAGADFGCTDGTTLRDFSPAIVDQNGIAAHPSNDLSGFATDQWYTRTFILTPLAGKTIAYASVALEGNSNGNYTAYFRHVKQLDNTGALKQTFFATSLQTSQIIGLNSYENYALNQCTVYGMSGTRTAPNISLTSLSIPKTSLIDWVAPSIASSLTPTIPSVNSTLPTLDVQTSVDAGVTWQSCTSYAAIPNMLAGMSMSGLNLMLRQVFTMLGTDPTLTPTLTGLALSIQPSYAATKADVVQSESTQANWNAGTLTRLAANANNSLTLNEVSQNWNAGPLANQTLYGSSGPFQELQAGKIYVACNAGATSDVRSRLDFAGQWQNFTAEVDIAIGTAIGSTTVGMVYRTTGWSNTENTFAWKVWYTPGSLNLGYGTNGGADSYTAVASQAITLSSGTYHHMKLVVNGTTHQVYMDGVLIINITSSQYNQSGYLGLAFYNHAADGLVHGGLFDNFGICAALTGTWQSVTLALSGAVAVGNSLIAWQEAPDPTGLTTLVVQTSIDGGATYQACTNGSTIPGLTTGLSLSGKTLIIQILFTSPNAALTPVVTGLTAWIIGQFNATGHWISPALALTNVGRAGASLVNWNAVLPNAGTTLVARTSVDGGATYQTIASAGNPIANITVQPAPTADTFAVNSSANYTSTFGLGGAVATWTWNTSSSQLQAVGGTKSQLLYNGLTATDVDMMCIMSQSENGGLVWRVVDASDYYELLVRDASGSGGANQFALNKMSAGIQTTIQTTTIPTFTPGMYHAIRVTMFGSVITLYFDGTQIYQYTDASPLGAGQCGLRNNGGTSYFYLFRVQPQGEAVTSVSVLTKLTLTSTDPLNTPQVTDVATLVTGPSIGIGSLVAGTAYQQTYVSKNIDDLNRQSNYWWNIVSSGQFPGLSLKQLVFQAENASPAPFPIAQANQVTQLSGQSIGDIQVAGLSVEYSGDLYRNRMILQNANATQTFTQYFVGDGTSRSWTLDYPVAVGTVPIVTLNASAAVPQPIGILGQVTGKDYYYTPGATGISQDNSQAALTGIQTLIVTYTGTFLQDVTRNNTGGFAGTVSQSQLAAIDGTSGIVTVVEDLSQNVATSNMTVAQAIAYGDSQLQRFGVIGRTVTFATYRQGLQPGQQLAVFIPLQTMQNAQTLITQVDTSTIMGPDGSAIYKYAITATEGPALGSWAKLAGAVFG